MNSEYHNEVKGYSRAAQVFAITRFQPVHISMGITQLPIAETDICSLLEEVEHVEHHTSCPVAT